MGEFKGTPGLWTREQGATRGAWIGNAEGTWAALACGDSTEEADANADLIAAAPSLLEVAQDLLTLIALVAPGYEESTVCANARAALSLATGEA